MSRADPFGFVSYALELSRYIHLNPVKAAMVQMSGEYRWSSYQSYLGLTARPAWLRTTELLGYFSGEEKKKQDSYRSFVEANKGEEIAQRSGTRIAGR